MPKSAVYSWRLTPGLKLALEEAASRKGESVAEVLERISREWLARTSSADDEEEQRRLHAAVSKHLGTIAGGDPDRSARAREMVRAHLGRRRGHTA